MRIQSPMRTTLVIDDAVLAEARRRALELEVTLSELVTRSLRRSLADEGGVAEPALGLPTWGDPELPQHHEPAELAAFLHDDDIVPIRPR